MPVKQKIRRNQKKMAAVELTIDGVIWDKQLKAGRPVVLIGEAFLTGVGIGGGPIIGEPPWEGVPKPPVVEHPIWPPKWPSGGPIIPPEVPPTEPPPPLESNWEWGWSPAHGWHPVYVPGGKPQPPPIEVPPPA